VCALARCMHGSSATLIARLRALLHTLLLSKIPIHFHKLTYAFFHAHFERFQARLKANLDESNIADDDDDDDEDSDEEDEEGGGVLEEEDVALFPLFDSCYDNLRNLKLIKVTEKMYSELLFARIEERITAKCKGNFATRYLGKVIEWVHTAVLPWLHHLLSPPHQHHQHQHRQPATPLPGRKEVEAKTYGDDDSYLQWRSRLLFSVYHRFAELRISEFFDIIVDFPDSEAAIVDLKECVAHIAHQQELVHSLQSSLEKRLLQPGANTADIITTYIATIRSLRLLDPTGVLLEAVATPIRHYLKARPDSVRKIVEGLSCDGTDGTRSELRAELEASPDGNTHDADDSDAEEETGGDPMAWQPDPLEADPTKTSSSRRSADIISTFLGIFGKGGTELFVHEYRELLGDKLITRDTYNTDRDVALLELLKLRFGEAALHECEVMLKDMAESKRVNANIQEVLAGKMQDEASKELGAVMETTIISQEFWPNLEKGEEEFKPPAPVEKLLKQYAATYEHLKNPREIKWVPNLGVVDIELELEDRTLELQVTPVQATIVYAFEDQPVWKLNELATHMGVEPSFVRKHINFWVNRGVLREATDDNGVEYRLIETVTKEDAMFVHRGGDFADDVAQQKEGFTESQEVAIRSYVVGMMQNFKALPLSRIHNMLGFFNDNKFYYPSSPETEKLLSTLLNTMVEGGVLEQEDGLYSKATVV